MRQRLALGGLSVVVLSAVIVAWMLHEPGSASAMEVLAQNLRTAKSYSVDWVAELKVSNAPGDPPILNTITGTWHWQAPGSVHFVTKGNGQGPGQESESIHPAGKPGIMIDHQRKSFQRVPARLGYMSPFVRMLDQLGKFSGEADRDLGTKQINGRQARGFQVDSQKIDPDAHGGPVEIWMDAKSNLPILIEMEFPSAAAEATMRMQNFRWNVELDAKLFEPTPPAGYNDTTRQPPPVDEQIARIKEALMLYAQLSEGHYPPGKMIYGDVMRDEMRKMAGFEGPVTPEQLRNEMFLRIQQATLGMGTINAILRDNPDAAYYGSQVGPSNEDEILMRWKLENGAYQVLYGDLRSESVSGSRLRELETR